jgi:pilus assembly protein CpaB
MRAKMILALLFLASLAVFATIYADSVVRSKKGGAAQNGEILVATANLPAGTLLRAQDMAWRPAHRQPEPGEIVRSPALKPAAGSGSDPRTEILGAALRAPLAAGAAIRRDIVVKPGDRDFLPTVLPPGKRAIAIPVATAGASLGMLFPGDSVDLILTQTFKDNAPLTRRSVSETVVRDLRVLAIDAGAGKALGDRGALGRSVTVEVSPEQAEEVNVAAELGKLSLTLRGAAAATSSPRSTAGDLAKPTWAEDVSPALVGAMRPQKIVAVEPFKILIIRGGKSEVVTLR